jgi:hypothetical protein
MARADSTRGQRRVLRGDEAQQPLHIARGRDVALEDHRARQPLRCGAQAILLTRDHDDATATTAEEPGRRQTHTGAGASGQNLSSRRLHAAPRGPPSRRREPGGVCNPRRAIRRTPRPGAGPSPGPAGIPVSPYDSARHAGNLASGPYRSRRRKAPSWQSLGLGGLRSACEQADRLFGIARFGRRAQLDPVRAWAYCAAAA